MKSILLTTAAGWFARLLAIAVNVVSMPVVLHSLGATRTGVMLIALSLGSWIGLGNAGFGRVVSIIVARYYRRSPAFVADAVSHITSLSTRFYAILFMISAAIFLLSAPSIDLGSGGAAFASEFTVSTVAIFLSMALWFHLSIFEGVDAGCHELYRLYWFQIIAYAVTLLLMFTAFRRTPSLLFATLLIGAGFVLGNLMHAVDVRRRHGLLFKSTNRARQVLARSVVYSSIDYTMISMAISIIFQFTTGVVGLLVGADEILNLGIFMRVMTSVGGIILTVTTPLSALIAGKLGQQDRAAAVKVAVLSAVGLLLSVGTGALVFYSFGEQILALWLKTPVVYDPAFRLFAAALIFVTAVWAIASAVAIGFGNLRHVARVHLLLSVVVLPLAYVCFRSLGQAGILMAIDLVLFGGAVASVAGRPRIRRPALRWPGRFPSYRRAAGFGRIK